MNQAQAGEFGAPAAREAARRELLTVVSGASPEEAWGRLVAVQAEIALDPENGSKATAAARLVAEATGMLPAGESASALQTLAAELDARRAADLLAAIRRERKRRPK